jgi:hypothetical protein
LNRRNPKIRLTLRILKIETSGLVQNDQKNKEKIKVGGSRGWYVPNMVIKRSIYEFWALIGRRCCVLKIVCVCSLSKLRVSLLRKTLDWMKNRVAGVDTGYRLDGGV